MIVSGFIIYLVDIVFSLIIAFLVIEKLYISKKFNKEAHFHLYNDLFSWEMFFILLSISNIIQIIILFNITNTFILNLLFKISLLLMYNNFWSKIIHSERLMNIITYEKHYFAGIIPFIIIVTLFIFIYDIIILIIIFILTSILPLLIIEIFLKNTGVTMRQSLIISIGVIFFGMGFIFNPGLLSNLVGLIEIPDLLISLTYFIAPLLFYSCFSFI